VKLVQGEGYPVQAVCCLLGYPRSSYYHYAQAKPWSRAQIAPDQEVKEAIQAVAGRWSTYGYRRITAQLRRSKEAGGFEIRANHKRVRRLMREMGLQARTGTSPQEAHD
jgi:hypothetical protein